MASLPASDQSPSCETTRICRTKLDWQLVFFKNFKNLFPVLQVKLYEKSAGADASLLNGSTDIKKKFGDLEGN